MNGPFPVAHSFMPRTRKPRARIPSQQKIEKAPPPVTGETEGLFDIVARSQKGFRQLIDSFDRIAFNFSLAGEIRVINRRFAEVVGLAFAEIINHPLEEFIAEPSRDEMARVLPQLLEARSWTGIVRVRWRRTNQARIYDCTLRAVVEQGEVTGVTGLARDISEQRETETRFTELFETLHEGVYFASPEGELLDVNPAAVRMLGYRSKEELTAPPASRHFAEPGQRAALIRDLQRHGSVRDRNLSLRRKDGSLLHVRNSSVAIRNAKGEFVRFQGSLTDVTEREEMEKRLREEQEFVRRLVAAFPDIIAVLDTAGRYTFVSPRVQETLGYTPDEFIGMKLEERPHPDDRESLLEFFRRLTGGEMNSGTIEYRTSHKDGGWRSIRASASPLTNADGRIIGIVASARDVTESRRLEQHLLQSEKLAAIGQMVSGVAHELNNPLTAILGVSDLLRERVTDEGLRRQSELIHKQARKAAELVQGLLMFSRPSKPQSQKVKVSELAERAIELRKSELQARHITANIRSGASNLFVEASPNQIVQVLVNLIANAEQAISSLRDHGRIELRISQVEDKVEILLDDDGPGIEPELRSKIFDPFFTTRRSIGGTGLGLTIALVIVKEHGGTIEAQAAPMGGARLRIQLPAADGYATAARQSTPAEGIAGLRILVVDDEEAIREIIEEGLATQGASVSGVATAEEAWKKLNSADYDLVLCDFNLGNESGTALFERVCGRKGQPAPQFIFITGEFLDEGRTAQLEKQGARTLQKPFQISQLAGVIEAFRKESGAKIEQR